MNLQPPPNLRIGVDQIGIVIIPGGKKPLSTVTHRRVGCPRVSPIQVHAEYLRCSKCYVPLTKLAADYITHNLGASYDESTNSFRV